MKNKKKSTMLLILVGMIILFINSFPALAAQKSFTVDFEDGTFGELENDGNLTIVTEDGNKYAKCNEDIMDVAWLSIEKDVLDFDIVFDLKQVKVNRPEAHFGISARRTSDGSSQFDIQYNGTYDFFDINRYYQGVKQRLNVYQDEIKVTTGTWCKLGIRVKDNVVSWYKDGELVVSGIDNDELIKSGELKFFTYSVGVCIDNIKYGEVNSIDMKTGDFIKEEPVTEELTEVIPETGDSGINIIVAIFVLCSMLLILVKVKQKINA